MPWGLLSSLAWQFWISTAASICRRSPSRRPASSRAPLGHLAGERPWHRVSGRRRRQCRARRRGHCAESKEPYQAAIGAGDSWRRVFRAKSSC
ncbi:hypothetical protein B0T17DRAFT_542953 [Bombardia bombarda]|uniref:Secreted protein n=1 Tax=Bombardia bombarda TaxID=252184 RepID=A0AA39T2P4_9PEZI|nr:hypothetical protein B0T17DRAFT_542953 [Bombardia bombarda]